MYQLFWRGKKNQHRGLRSLFKIVNMAEFLKIDTKIDSNFGCGRSLSFQERKLNRENKKLLYKITRATSF